MADCRPCVLKAVAGVALILFFGFTGVNLFFEYGHPNIFCVIGVIAGVLTGINTAIGNAFCERPYCRTPLRKWDAQNLDRFTVNPPKGYKDALKERAEAQGLSLNRLMRLLAECELGISA